MDVKLDYESMKAALEAAVEKLWDDWKYRSLGDPYDRTAWKAYTAAWTVLSAFYDETLRQMHGSED